MRTAAPDASVVVEGDNLLAMAAMADASFARVYLDPPFNTGRVQGRAVYTSRPPDVSRPRPADGAPVFRGFHGRDYERVVGLLRSYDGLVTAEKAARGKLPTDVWWHTIVPTTGHEKTGYPTQKPEGILRRIVAASTRPGDAVLDPFAGSGTTGAVAVGLGRRAVLIDHNPDAIDVMATRMPGAEIRRQPSAASEA